MSEPTDRAARSTPVWWVLVTVVLVLGWLLVAPYLAFGAVITAAPFFGEQPTRAELTTAHRLLAADVAVAVGVPLVGRVLASVLRQPPRWLFVIMLVIGVVFAGLLAADLYGNESR